MRFADGGWPVFVFVAFMIGVRALAAAAKKQQQRAPQAPDVGTDSSRAELGEALQRAMQKLKQAEAQARSAPARPPGARQRPALKGRPSGRIFAEPGPQSGGSDTEDFDEQAAKLTETRAREAVAAFERGRDAAPAPAALQPSATTRIAPSIRPAVRVAAPVTPVTTAARAPVGSRATLARFADGTLQGAMVLGEIFGRPKADR